MLAVRPAAADSTSTLAAVKERGYVACGVNDRLPGLALQDNRKQWSGLAIDYCRAVAAAVLGDATKVRVLTMPPARRLDALRDGRLDVLIQYTSALPESAANSGVRDAAVLHIDAQTVVVPKAAGVRELQELEGKSICIQRDTPHRARLEDWFDERKRTFQVKMLDTSEALLAGLLSGKCTGVTQDITPFSGALISAGRARDYMMLPDIVGKDLLAAYVRTGDDKWFDIVRWTHFALVEAEERGITRATVDQERRSPEAAVRRFLGADGGIAGALGLDDAWAYQAIKQVGNYGEIYERTIGRESPLRLSRGVNALWVHGGVMYAPPIDGEPTTTLLGEAPPGRHE